MILLEEEALLTDVQLLVLIAGSIAALALVAAGMAYREARRVRLLLEAILAAGRAREIQAVRRALSRRPSRRYIVFRLIPESEISERSLNHALLQTARTLLGSSFMASSGFQLVYYNPLTRKGVIRVRSDYRNATLAVLGILREVDGKSVLVLPLITVGTIRRAKKIADSA